MRRIPIIAFFLALLAIAPARADFAAGAVMLEHAGRPLATFQVEVAAAPEERERGLMEREALGPNHGMLFDFGEPTMARMWMRNTLIPLDIIFVDADGVIRHIHAEAKPKDETVIASPVPVRWVLEISGGRAETLGLQTGDRMKVQARPAKL